MSAYPYLDSQNIAIKQDVSFPALGGVDLVTDKLSVNPGTLQDCLNYEVGTEPGYKQIDGLMRYAGRSYNVVNRPICANTTSNTGLYHGGEYKVSLDDDDNNDFIGEIKPIKLDEGSICYQILSGTEPELYDSGDGSVEDTRKSYYIYGEETEADPWFSFSAQEFDEDTGNTVGSPLLLFEMYPSNRYFVHYISNRVYVALKNSVDNRLHVFEFDEQLALVRQYTTESPVQGFLWGLSSSPDGRYIGVVVSENSETDYGIVLFDATDGTELTRLSEPFGETGSAYDVAFDEDYNIYVGGGTSGGNLAKFNISGTELWKETVVGGGFVGGTTGRFLSYRDGFLYASNGGSVVSRIDPDNGNELWTVNADHGSAANGGIEIDSSGSVAYVVEAGNSKPKTLYIQDSGGAEILSAEAEVVTSSRLLPWYGHNDSLYVTYSVPPARISTSTGGVLWESEASNLWSEGVVALGELIEPLGLRVYPDRNDKNTYAVIFNQAITEYTSVDDFITKYYEHNKGLAADSFKPPGSGPITSLFELDDMVYATRDNEAGDAGKLYKTTDLPDLAKDVEWEEIDLGLTLDFKNGRTDPLTIYDKEFLDVEPEPSDPVLNRLGTEAESVPTLDLVGPSLNVTTTTGAWATPEHALDDDSDDVVATAFRRHASQNVWYQTQILRITGFDIGRDASKFARVVGVKADVSYGYKTFLMSGGEGQFRMKSAHLTNVGGSDNKRDDTIRTQTTADGDMFYTSTLGGTTDDWNPGDPSIENFFDEDFGIDLVFEGRWISGSVTTSSQGNRFYVRWVKMSVYFEDGSERVYFWNGTSDVAEADVLDTQVESGSWENDDAKGTFTLYNAVTPENIVPDLEIRSAPDGAGAYIADTDGVTTSGVFPTSTQINDENAFVQTIKTNFYMDEAKEAIYGVTGAGPAFTFDGKYMRQIRAPVPKEKDKPRHIANHQDHLVLGFKSGSILVSVAGEPTLFDGVEGASEWGFGSRITGLLPLKGNALAVFTRDSTHAFIGNSLENFTTQYISKTSGALEYSVVNMGQPIYCDNFGISNIGVTEQYGDFNWNKLSRSISPWIQGAIQESSGFMYNYPKIVTALPIRHKNQYRLYFTDGTNMTMTMAPVPEGDFPMFTFHNYAEGNDFDERHFVPTAALSTILSDGRELIMLGDRHGDIYVLEQGTGILTNSELIPYDSYMVFNPFNGDMPVQNIKYNQAFVHLKHSGQQELTLSAGVNYLQPVPNTFNDTVEGITPLGGIHFDLVPDKIVAHLPSVTDGFSLRINSVGNGNLPHIVQAITYKVAPSSSKNAAPNRY